MKQEQKSKSKTKTKTILVGRATRTRRDAGHKRMPDVRRQCCELPETMPIRANNTAIDNGRAFTANEDQQATAPVHPGCVRTYVIKTETIYECPRPVPSQPCHISVPEQVRRMLDALLAGVGPCEPRELGTPALKAVQRAAHLPSDGHAAKDRTLQATTFVSDFNRSTVRPTQPRSMNRSSRADQEVVNRLHVLVCTPLVN